MPQRAVVIGQGYVGLPVAVRAVEAGFSVVGFDVDEWKVERLGAGTSYVEDIPDARLQAALATGRYLPTHKTDDLTDFDVAVISVPTPLKEGQPDLRYIEDASKMLAPYVRAGSCVVLESTTYPGTTEELVAPLLAAGSGLVPGDDFFLGYSPERIDPGNPTFTFENTPKVVSGVNEKSAAAVAEFYGQLVDRVVLTKGTREAELTKLLENTFRHVNIALVNEIAMFANDLDIDVWDAIDAASTKPFGFMPFTPGPGVGGHCLPIDPSYLSWRVRRSLGRSFRFVELANDVNEHMPDYVVNRLRAALNDRQLPVNGRRVLLLGLAYKKNTGDARSTPSRRITELLLQLGATVEVADPHVADRDVPPGTTRVECTPETLARADAVLFLVDHDRFDLDMVRAHARYVLDCRNRLGGEPGDRFEVL